MSVKPGSLAAAYALDWIIGDPRGFPHPVRLIGQMISAGEMWLRHPRPPAEDVMRGAVLTGLVVGSTWAAARALKRGGLWAEVLLAWAALATRSLLDESAAVIKAVEAGNLTLARVRLSLIVGRDTADLDRPEILRAVVETVAEGLCDGIVAPLFYLAVGGVPLAFAYKAVNTLDSMIGHRDFPYLYFGRAAARLDDAANYLPARLSAGAICAAALVTGDDMRQAWQIFRRDGDRHPSPNAGQSEAAMAGALRVRLGGMNYYNGTPSPKPFLGEEGMPATVGAARQSLRIAGVASLLVFGAAWCFSWIWSRR